MRIYTRKGDTGETGLVGGGRTAKNSLRIRAVGDVDELNATVGVARTLATTDPDLDSELARIQHWLFDLGAELASPPEVVMDYATITNVHAEYLEKSMDRLSVEAPPLRAFVLPGGSPLASALHLARATCRRAERTVLDLHQSEEVRSEARKFINRLSDWFFIAARTANARQGVQDVEWKRTEVK